MQTPRTNEDEGNELSEAVAPQNEKSLLQLLLFGQIPPPPPTQDEDNVDKRPPEDDLKTANQTFPELKIQHKKKR